MPNKEYEKELKPYSPDSVKQGLNNPNMAEPGNEQLIPYERPTTK